MTRYLMTLRLAGIRLVAVGRRRHTERGDVPGWVLVTVMTAGLVAALWAVAGDTLTTMLSDALASVTG
ncbi:MAG TPA: hypothetical protein VFT75_13055 [Nocardioidaceae bacterium]|jgi:hypothetical protein|nr:hypothetical protein [Nocardioidaceae bacterium]